MPGRAAQQVDQYMGFAGSAELNPYVDRVGLEVDVAGAKSSEVSRTSWVCKYAPHDLRLVGRLAKLRGGRHQCSRKKA